MQEPKYQFLAGNNMPVFSSKDNLITNKLVAGKYNDLQSRIKSETELLVIWSNAKQGGTQTYYLPKLFNVMLYVIQGTVRITGYGKVDEESLAVLNNESETTEISAVTDAQFLLLAGKPINEKVTQQGPFVMNTTTEILKLSAIIEWVKWEF